MNLNHAMTNLRYLAVLPMVALVGCRSAPAFNVLGSYFPAWLFCLLVGVLLTTAARVVAAQIQPGGGTESTVADVFMPDRFFHLCHLADFLSYVRTNCHE